MDINWYGLSCFRIREGGAVVVCDPYDKKVGNLPKLRTDIVTVSHNQAGHNGVARLTGEFKVLQGPGEYEVQNVFITAATTYHKQQDETFGERNIIYFLDFGGLTIGHLGDLGKAPSQSEIEELNLGEVDVLMVPVGGGATLDPTSAVEVVGMFDPKLVIPMHYQQSGLSAKWVQELEPVEKFLKELGVSAPDPTGTLKISKSSLPEETQVALLSVTQ